MLRASPGLVSNSSAVTSTIDLTGSPSALIINYGTGPTAIQVGRGTVPSGIDLDITACLSKYGANPTFEKTGYGTLRLNPGTAPNDANFVVRAGRLRIDDPAALGSGRFALDGGILAYGGSTASLAKSIVLDGNGTIEVQARTETLTVTNPLSGGGGLTIVGPGTLVLPAGSTYYGGTTVDSVEFSTNDDSVFGFGSVTVVNGGSVRFTATVSTARTFNLNTGSLDVTNGSVLTLSGARVNGGFLRGNGAFALTGGTTLTGATTFNSTVLNVTGPVSVQNLSNNGAINIPSGQSLAMNYATNGAAGRITVNGTATVSDFTSYGQINVPNVGLINNTGSPSGIVLGGGSTTFVGTVATPGGVINVGTQPMHVRGGLLVNNGAIGNSTGTGQVIVDYGGFAKGAGYYDTIPQTINGGRFSPGNSPGRVTVGSVNMNPGGIYDFEINNATGIAGPTGTTNLSGWDLTIVSNQINPALSNLTVSATPANPFTINLVTLRNPSPPDIPDAMANFSSGTVPFSWLAFDVNPAGSVTNWDPSAIVINTSQVMNTFTGTFGIVRDTANPFQFYINYTPVPEPLFMLAGSFAAIAVLSRWSRMHPRFGTIRSWLK